KRREAAGETDVEREHVKEPLAPVAAVEVEVCGEFLCRLVEDIERAVQIVDEETIRASGFLAQGVLAREHAVGLSLAFELAGDRHRDVVLQLERQVRRRGGG